jgi:hypothetical protein
LDFGGWQLPFLAQQIFDGLHTGQRLPEKNYSNFMLNLPKHVCTNNLLVSLKYWYCFELKQKLQLQNIKGLLIMVFFYIFNDYERQ